MAISVGTVTALTGAIELTETAPTLATMLGLAVGIDYALFILSRYRQNLDDGLEPREARPRRRPAPPAAPSCSPARPS